MLIRFEGILKIYSFAARLQITLISEWFELKTKDQRLDSELQKKCSYTSLICSLIPLLTPELSYMKLLESELYS